MRSDIVVYRFGEFELDPKRGRLLRAGQPLRIKDKALAVLACLVEHAPAVVQREALAKAAWGGTASVSSVEKAISQSRQVLGDDDGCAYIETVPNRGYRFVGVVERCEVPDTSAADSLKDDSFRAFVTGRRELATLNRRSVAEALRGFEHTIEREPGYAPAHIALATACALSFEATRFDAVCDLEALRRAVAHARRATELSPTSADAWSTLGFALYVQGEIEAAVIAACKAVAWEKGSWRHWLRLAYVSWGEDRMEAAHAALMLRPRLALAHWMRATVLIARGAFEAALLELQEGCAAQDQQPKDDASYPAVGLHLLRGLVLAALGRLEEAAAAFAAELGGPDRGQVYSQECEANTWYALGAIRLRQRDFPAADAAFHRALEIAPAHVFSLAALGRPIPAFEPGDPRIVDGAIARAVALARGNRHVEAAQIYKDMLATSRVPNAGWILPVEPVLDVAARPEIWADALTMVQQRAT